VGLVVRVVLTPVEESAAVYFASTVPQRQPDRQSSPQALPNVPAKAIRVFSGLLRLTSIMGVIVCAFGFPYSKLAVQLYGGRLLVENSGAYLLSLYTIYLLLISVNGISECFAFSLMDTYQILNHGTFLLFASIAHLLCNALLCFLVGAPGFILANCLSTLLRIVYNWRHIRNQIGSLKPLSIGALLPSQNSLVLLLFALFSTTVSYFLFGTVGGLLHDGAHVAVGGVMFLLLMAYLYQAEDLFTIFDERNE